MTPTRSKRVVLLAAVLALVGCPAPTGMPRTGGDGGSATGSVCANGVTAPSTSGLTCPSGGGTFCQALALCSGNPQPVTCRCFGGSTTPTCASPSCPTQPQPDVVQCPLTFVSPGSWCFGPLPATCYGLVRDCSTGESHIDDCSCVNSSWYCPAAFCDAGVRDVPIVFEASVLDVPVTADAIDFDTVTEVGVDAGIDATDVANDAATDGDADPGDGGG